MKSISSKISLLNERKTKIMQGGGPKSIEKQHQRGKLTARERIELLLDKNSFSEQDIFLKHRSTDFGLDGKDLPGEGVVTGRGLIDNRLVFLYSQDFTVMGGSAGEAHCKKICNVMDMAYKVGKPVIGINDSAGARIQEVMGSANGYPLIFYRNTLLSGMVPQISLVLGPCAGGAVYSPALTDFIFVVKDLSLMFITGPDVIKAVTRENVSQQELGGAKVHSSITGVAHFFADNEEDAFQMVRKLLSYLPSNSNEKSPRLDLGDDRNRKDLELQHIIPVHPNKSYDIRDFIVKIVDVCDFFEVQAGFATNICVGFARMNGQSIGIVANQPRVKAGCLDIDASNKAARFVRFCDAFNIPLLTFVDCPGYLPGIDQEYSAIIRHGAKLLYAYSEATVPKITIFVRKNYGGAYSAMSPQGVGADYVIGLPTTEYAIMGPEAAVNIIYRDDINKSDNQEETRQRFIEDYREKYASPYGLAEYGLINDVIDPMELRPYIIDLLETLSEKISEQPYKKHGNIPL